MQPRRIRFLFCLLIPGLIFANVRDASAVVANAWHIPDNSTDLGGTHMRNPWIEIGNNTSITIYSGVQKFDNSFGTANQTGGGVYYKGASQGVWNFVPFDTGMGQVVTTGNNQYWHASFTPSAVGIGTTEVIQYYLYLTFDGVNGVQNTYIFAPAGLGDRGSNVTGTESVAATSPFTVRNRPGWIFHANNRVNSGNDVQFWAKVGYIGDPNNLNTRWATNGVLYYTTDGTEPVPGVTLGTSGSASTQVATFSYDHPENSNQNGGTQSIAGTAMWWVATGPNLLATPLGTTIKYKIGFWNPSNNEQKFGDYNAGDGGNYLGHIFSFTNGTVGDPVLTVNGVSANYTTSHVFVNETLGESVPFTANFAPGQANVTAVELFTNLNRREKAGQDSNGDGIEDGILIPSGDMVVAGDDSQYYKAYTMNSLGGGNYSFALNANKTGAYRMTARWKVDGDPNWRYYTNIGAGRRDHAIVVSPVDARNINLYEVNVFNLDGSGTELNQRGTLEDLYDAPNAPHQGAQNHWNLGYLQNLGCNWMWFQPIHPITQEAQQGHNPGSPYSVRSFFDINPLMSTNYNAAAGPNDAGNRNAAKAAFQGLVSAANNAGVGIMLDAPFNHTAPDCEISSQGTSLFGSSPSAGSFFRDVEARFYSRSGNYAMRASGSGNIAVAPDRGDFGKWDDVRDVYFGRYAALVDINPDNNGNYLNEQDWFDYSIGDENSFGAGNGHFDTVTRNVWKYFADYTLYWLDQTGVPPGSSLSTQTSHGIGGLRADFGQGLPPQLWEYIINKTRARKWNFVFMAESLDGGAVTYRSNRHFDLLNENIVFPLKNASSTSDFRGIFDGRRSAYGQSLVLLNNMSHDEEAYTDPWFAVILYAVCSAIDGAPLIFPGQELGISRTFGYQLYETNFGKQIADFKDFNSMTPAWSDADFGNDQLYPVYAGMGLARLFSPALRSANRYYLNQTDSTIQQSIFSVAKYETAGGSPVNTDVVFAFANLNRNADQQGNFNVNIGGPSPSGNLFGIRANRTYNIRNIAAYNAQNPYRRDYLLWGPGRTGSDILTNGIFVKMFKVPNAPAAWGEPWSDTGYSGIGAGNHVFDWDDTNHNGVHDPGEASEPFTDRNGSGSHDPDTPYEAQYLKLYDVTAPTGTPGPATTLNPYFYTIGTSTTISWAAAPADSEGITPCYNVNVTINGNTTSYYTCGTSMVISAALGQSAIVTIQTVNPNDNSVTGPSSGAVTVKFLDANADEDGDGMSNGKEDMAGTNPLDPVSILKITGITRPDANNVSLTWNSVSGKTYHVDSASRATGPYTPIGSDVTANSATTTITVPATTPAFYRVRLVP